MAFRGLYASCNSSDEAPVARQMHIGRTLVWAPARMWASLLGPLLLMVLFPGRAPAQDVFSSSAAPTSCQQGEPPNVFKQVGMNPLTCHGQTAPEDSQKQCSLAGMKMIAHVGETCYYCAPIVSPANSIVIPLDQVAQAAAQGFSCGSDQVDPSCMAICSKTGGQKYIPPSSAGGTPNPAPTEGGPPASAGGLIPGPAGGKGYVPGPNACLPQGPGGYNYCANGPGARLPAGCTCDVTTPPAAKGVNRAPAPQQSTQTQTKKPAPAPAPPSLAAIYAKMNACLRAKVPYMPVFTQDAKYMTQARYAAQGTVPLSDTMDQIPFRSQVFILETAAAFQAQAYHDSKYGQSDRQTNPTIAQDSLVGWFGRCVSDAGIVPTGTNLDPTAPPNAYATFVGTDNAMARRFSFISGYGTEMLPPLSLLPPKTAPAP